MAPNNSHRPASGPNPSSAQTAAGGTPACRKRGFSESGHQLEKLEFALAVAMTRGDAARTEQLRAAIAALGGNREEPGT